MLQTPRWLLRSRLWCTRGAAASSTSAAACPPDPRPHSPGHSDPAGGGLLDTRQTWHPCWMMITGCCYSFLQIISVSPNMGNRSAPRSLSGATRATSSSAMSLLPTLASMCAEPTTPSASLPLALWLWVCTTRSVSNVWQCLEASASNDHQTWLTSLNTPPLTAAPGSPAPPSIEHVARERSGASSYRLSWATTSFSPLMGHRLLLKEVRKGLRQCR